MVRASDLVKGKTTSLYDPGTKDSSPRDTAPKEALREEARRSLRLSEIDVLKLKTGKHQETPIPDEIARTIVEELRMPQQETEKELMTSPSSPLAMAINVPPVRQDEIPAAETSEGRPEEIGIRRIYVATKQYMAYVREQVKKGESLQLEPALIYINNILNSSEDMVSQIYQLTVDYEQEDDYYLSSPINTMVYGVKISQRMGYDKSELIEFSLAALLHDIGMFMIPDQILSKQGRLSDDEMDLIKRHPDFAVEILAPFATMYPKTIEAIYEHQERANGQGYPRGLKGDEICDFAQIVGICDSYEAMTHHRPHKKILLQSDSIKELIGSKTKLFEPRIIKMFLDEISIYPIGSYIRLNNRNIGRVVATSKGNPMKPVVNLIFDEKGKKIEPPRTMDLKNFPVLNIEASISADDLPVN